MPIPDISTETLQAVSSLIVLVGAVLFGGWRAVELILKWAGRGNRQQADGGPVLVTEKSCQAKHEATDERIGRIESKLDVLIQDVAEFFSELRLMQGRQQERDQALLGSAPRPRRKRS